MRYQIEFAESVKAHLEALTAVSGHGAGVGRNSARERAPGRDSQSEAAQAKSRSTLGITYRKLRVFYDVSEGPLQTVRMLAVGVKDRKILRIGGEEIQL